MRVCGCSPVLPLRPHASGVFRKPTASGRKLPTWAETQELLRDYPKTLYQSLLLRHAGNIFLTLRGHLADEMREINFCRVRLGELLRMLEEPAETSEAAPTNSAPVQASLSRWLQGSPRDADALREPVGGGNAARIGRRDGGDAQEAIYRAGERVSDQRQRLKKVEAAMLRTAEEFVSARLGAMNVAEMFLEEHAESDEAIAEITGFFRGGVTAIAPFRGWVFAWRTDWRIVRAGRAVRSCRRALAGFGLGSAAGH